MQVSKGNEEIDANMGQGLLIIIASYAVLYIEFYTPTLRACYYSISELTVYIYKVFPLTALYGSSLTILYDLLKNNYLYELSANIYNAYVLRVTLSSGIY